MDINRISQVQQTYTAKTAKKLYQPQSVGTSKDTLNVSSFAKELSIAKSAVDKTPDVRQAKVDQIKQQMEAGTYNVTAAQVAAKILGMS